MMMHELELAEAYIPYQEDTSMFHPKEGLENGTIFTALYKPYKPKEGCGCYKMLERECASCEETNY